jgi:hypothetical protein
MGGSLRTAHINLSNTENFYSPLLAFCPVLSVVDDVLSAELLADSLLSVSHAGAFFPP